MWKQVKIYICEKGGCLMESFLFSEYLREVFQSQRFRVQIHVSEAQPICQYKS